ncbi:PQQ-binding-like beta-propeller repeat protein [Halorussus salilacus]|uniref:outer membrane protein assembly factor BamB family protein n=1 Tax=Halorussus salilacus TaxID=2953750 RepID=UPI0020A1B2FE|nr:PQQ-binding-like beta-propeller repeat protein [Halorussus salilacus]USZ68037.1 PQQ-binding-like beta-propeller repeat protein [Halorussus salilacus]
MRRREVLALSGIGLTGGCLRLTSDEDQSTQTTEESTTQSSSETTSGPTQTAETDETTETDETDDDRNAGIDLSEQWSFSGHSLAVRGDSLYTASYGNELRRYASDGTSEWSTSAVPEQYMLLNIETSLAATDSMVFVGASASGDEADNAELFALDADTGDEQWTHETRDDGTRTKMDYVAVHDGLVVFGSDADGSGDEQEPIVRALDAESGETVWELDEMEGHLVGIATTEQRIYAVGVFETYVVSASSGELVETFDWNTGFGGVVQTDDMLYTAGDPPLAYDMAAESKLWGPDISYEPNTRPSVGTNAVVLGTEAGWVIGLDPETGDTQWEARLSGESRVTPVTVEQTVWVVDERGTLYGIDQKTGEPHFEEEYDDSFSLASLSGQLVNGEDGAVYAIERS